VRVVVDTNVLIAALLVDGAAPRLLTAWRRGAFDLLTCELQLQEVRAVTRRPQVRALLKPALAGELVNRLRDLAVWVEALPPVQRSPDAFDNFLLALAQAGEADVLVSGDKRGLLALRKHGRCRIVGLRAFLDGLGLA